MDSKEDKQQIDSSNKKPEEKKEEEKKEPKDKFYGKSPKSII